ncbi:MAG: hypothetical protein KC983_02060 [Phycisphaerales bacterium]|nr:hypothetical protein [Phycisphaerales bacterium]
MTTCSTTCRHALAGACVLVAATIAGCSMSDRMVNTHDSLPMGVASAASLSTMHWAGWLAGSWRAERSLGDTPKGPGSTVFTEEHWRIASPGEMAGFNWTWVTNRGSAAFELLSLSMTDDGQGTYTARPGGMSPGVPFQLTECTMDRIVFENPEHDFPTRIVYERSGANAMHASIWGPGDDGTLQPGPSWNFVRMSSHTTMGAGDAAIR